jgi:ubiquitin thioesterase OTU1
MSEIRLRIRWSLGNSILSFKSSNTFREVQKEIESKTSIPVVYQDTRRGFPPKSFTFPGKTLLSSTDLQTGETLIIEKRETPLKSPDFSDCLKLFRRIIPADNSCLFNSVAYALESRSCHEGQFLREVVSNIIEEAPEVYSSDLLGRENAEYAHWIRQATSWGGAIELSILSKYYGTCIGAVSIRDKRIDLFGQEEGFNKTIYVIYDGIHYDVLVKNITEDDLEASDMTVFDTSDQETWSLALSYAESLHSQRQFTDTQKFSLKCMICFAGLIGEDQARVHANETGHTNFCEY